MLLIIPSSVNPLVSISIPFNFISLEENLKFSCPFFTLFNVKFKTFPSFNGTIEKLSRIVSFVVFLCLLSTPEGSKPIDYKFSIFSYWAYKL